MENNMWRSRRSRRSSLSHCPRFGSRLKGGCGRIGRTTIVGKLRGDMIRSLSRRALLAMPAFAQEFRFTGKRPMIVHSDRPEDLESLPEYLSTWITPNDSFFVRQHLPR